MAVERLKFLRFKKAVGQVQQGLLFENFYDFYFVLLSYF